MQNTSQLYNTILASVNHWFEYKVNIAGVDYGEDMMRTLTTKHEMFDADPSVGKAIAGEIDLTMNMPSSDIPPIATIIPYVRVCNENAQSEWIQQGVFFVDTRQRSKNSSNVSVLTIHGFDAMLKAEQPFQSDTITGDSTDTQMVTEIASIMGVTVDPRTYTLMTEGYTIPLPTGYSCREVLGYIASAYVGCFIMSDTGQLRLVSLTELPPESNLLYAQVDGQDYYLVFGTGANATRILV